LPHHPVLRFGSRSDRFAPCRVVRASRTRRVVRGPRPGASTTIPRPQKHDRRHRRECQKFVGDGPRSTWLPTDRQCIGLRFQPDRNSRRATLAVALRRFEIAPDAQSVQVGAFADSKRFEAKNRAALINTAAPGLTNLLVKRAAEALDEVEDVKIRLYESTESADPISQWSPEVSFDE